MKTVTEARRAGNNDINGNGWVEFQSVETRDMKMTMKATNVVKLRDPYLGACCCFSHHHRRTPYRGLPDGRLMQIVLRVELHA